MGNATETVSIKIPPQRIESMIAFYEGLNNLGKAGFILTIEEEDQEPFLEAYEEHYNKHGEYW